MPALSVRILPSAVAVDAADIPFAIALPPLISSHAAFVGLSVTRFAFAVARFVPAPFRTVAEPPVTLRPFE